MDTGIATMAAISRIGPKRLVLALLLLAGCQQNPAGASDSLAHAREACEAGISEACRLLADGPHGPPARPPHPASESHAAKVQRDVAAIIRGMRQTSASNGL